MSMADEILFFFSIFTAAIEVCKTLDSHTVEKHLTIAIGRPNPKHTKESCHNGRKRQGYQHLKIY